MKKIVLLSAIQTPNDFEFLRDVLVKISRTLRNKRMECMTEVICQAKDCSGNEFVFWTSEAVDTLTFSKANIVANKLIGFAMLDLTASQISMYHSLDKLKNVVITDDDTLHIVVFDFRADSHYLRGCEPYDIVDALEQRFNRRYSIHFIYRDAVSDVYRNINNLLRINDVADTRRSIMSFVNQNASVLADNLCKII